jgi:drug/metabolite transporter (DMT)-like permease
VGIAAALGAAGCWALGSTLLASQGGRVDTLTMSALRNAWAILFFVPVVFITGGQHDIASMSATDILQLIGVGILVLAVAEVLYTAAVAVIGMSRAFTTTIGLYNLTAYGLAILLLDETLTLQLAIGSVLVLVGVYLVALYGREGGGAARTGGWSALRRPRDWWRRSSLPSILSESGEGAAPPVVPEARLPFIGSVPRVFWLGVLFAVGTGLTWGAANVWLQHASSGFDAGAAGAVRLPIAALILVAAVSVQPDSTLMRRAVPRRSMALLAVSGILTQGLATLFFIIALGEIGSGQSAVLFSTSPLWALPLGAIFLREHITVWVAVGAAISTGGIALIAL